MAYRCSKFNTFISVCGNLFPSPTNVGSPFVTATFTFSWLFMEIVQVFGGRYEGSELLSSIFCHLHGLCVKNMMANSQIHSKTSWWNPPRLGQWWRTRTVRRWIRVIRLQFRWGFCRYRGDEVEEDSQADSTDILWFITNNCQQVQHM